MEGSSKTRIPDLGEFRLADWRVSQAEGILALGSTLIRLEPRVMDVLVYLAASPGRVVPKEELLDAVWSGSFVEEGVLSQAIHSLRKSLGDDARQPRYIQTIPKRGYRLVAEVAAAEAPAAVLEPPRTERPEPTSDSRKYREARLLLLILIVMAASVSWIAWNRFKARPIRIVVVPFESIGMPDEDDEFFTAGLTEEITNDLAAIPSLQVISQPTAAQYRDTGKTVPEIGRELDVDYVLGGTVRWERDGSGRAKVRIVPRLSRVADDTHLPGQVLEQRVDDIFEVQERISRQVVEQLDLVPREAGEQALQRRPTGNLDAYRAYVRALELKNQPFYSETHLKQAIPLFERAARLDPDFAAAWAELSQTHSYLAFNSPSPARIEQARRALQRAMDIDRDLLEVRLAQAYFTYRCVGDFAAAERQLTEAAELFPNDAQVLESLALVQRRVGRLPEAIESFERAFQLNPREVRIPWWIGETYRALREYEEADEHLSQAVSMAPDQPVYWYEKAMNRLAWGDLDGVQSLIAEAPFPGDPTLALAAFQLDLYRRDDRKALEHLTPAVLNEAAPQVAARMAVLAVAARERSGDREGAAAAVEANRRMLEERVARFPNDYFSRAYLAVTLAQAGERARALAEADKAVRQVTDDRFSGPRILEARAMVHARLGLADGAIAELSRLARMSYQFAVSASDLRLNPAWDPLREDEQFEHLFGEIDD